jgi:hypothetical protein
MRHEHKPATKFLVKRMFLAGASYGQIGAHVNLLRGAIAGLCRRMKLRRTPVFDPTKLGSVARPYEGRVL